MAKLELVRPTTQPVVAAVGRVDVPAAALRHRFYVEARAIAELNCEKQEDVERVIGTANTRQVELYGWGSNVGQHVDNTGFMYLLPLSLDRSVLYARHGDQFWEHRLQVGEVVRLWDHAVHWTEDRGPAVAAFVGSFEEPQDELALQLLAHQVPALARGDYYGAPRVRDGFRVLLDDECWATGDHDTAEVILAADARARGMSVIPCAHCTRPAHVLDHHWPYQWDMNRCRVHRAGPDLPQAA